MKNLLSYRTMRIRYSINLLFFLIGSITAFGQTETYADSLISKGQYERLYPDTSEEVMEMPLKDTLLIAGVGDIMLGTNFPKASYLPPSGKSLLAPVDTFLRAPDCTFGNLEGTVLNDGGDVKKCSDPSKCYAFRMPEKLAWDLKKYGFDLISIANNHVGDFGSSGRKNTQKVLDSMQMVYAGLESCPWDTATIDGVTYGLCAFSPNTGTIKIHDYDRAKKIVEHLDSLSDIVVVSFHGGAEGSSHTHVTRETERFYGENRGNVYAFAHTVIDHGADIVFGHGPHVTRAIEVYKDRFISYSLGNFATYARFNLRGVSGIAPIMHVWTHRDGKFIKGQIIPTRQIGEGGPLYDSGKRVIKEIQKLVKEDFPESNLLINDDGTFGLQEKPTN